MRNWTIKVNGNVMFISASLNKCAQWVNDNYYKGNHRYTISSFPEREQPPKFERGDEQ